MDVKPIRNDDDYQVGNGCHTRTMGKCARHARKRSTGCLGVLVDDYERRRWPMPTPDPIDAILYEMDRLGLKPKDLEPYIGSRSRVWEVLNRKRRLTLEMIRKLAGALDMEPAVLVQEYPLGDQPDSIPAAEIFPDEPCAEGARIAATDAGDVWEEVLDKAVKSFGGHAHTKANLTPVQLVTQCYPFQGISFASGSSTADTDVAQKDEPATNETPLSWPLFVTPDRRATSNTVRQ